MLLINFIGAPGAGKTTLAAGVLHELKARGEHVEMISEYSKELILSEDTKTLQDELLVFAEKYRRIRTLQNVDIVLTDSPLLNSVVYGENQFEPESTAFYKKVAESFKSVYVVVESVVPYVSYGRMPDKTDAEKYGHRLANMIYKNSYPRINVQGDKESVTFVADYIETNWVSISQGDW